MEKENTFEQVAIKVATRAIKDHFKGGPVLTVPNGSTCRGTVVIRAAFQASTGEAVEVAPEDNRAAVNRALAQIGLWALSRCNEDHIRASVADVREGRTFDPEAHDRVSKVIEALKADPEKFGIGSISKVGSVKPTILREVTGVDLYTGGAQEKVPGSWDAIGFRVGSETEPLS